MEIFIPATKRDRSLTNVRQGLSVLLPTAKAAAPPGFFPVHIDKGRNKNFQLKTVLYIVLQG
ncbi:MAG: hypothetical protein FWE29_01800 [Defluviitaleaceae bacterium]|nr:hypothetical protein [Defluviitaleaceae bacterium]